MQHSKLDLLRPSRSLKGSEQVETMPNMAWKQCHLFTFTEARNHNQTKFFSKVRTIEYHSCNCKRTLLLNYAY